MTFVSVAADTLPKRARRGRGFDTDSANALLAIVTQDGQTASDGTDYAEIGKARGAASKARRLLLHVAPNPDLVKSRVYGSGDKADQPPFRWVVYLTTEKPAKKGKASK